MLHLTLPQKVSLASHGIWTDGAPMVQAQRRTRLTLNPNGYGIECATLRFGFNSPFSQICGAPKYQVLFNNPLIHMFNKSYRASHGLRDKHFLRICMRTANARVRPAMTMLQSPQPWIDRALAQDHMKSKVPVSAATADLPPSIFHPNKECSFH